MMKKENLTFTIIPDWMLDFGLSPAETLALAVIYGFSMEEGCYFSGSLSYLARKSMVSKRTIQNVLTSLVSGGWINKTETIENGVKRCKYVTGEKFATMANLAIGYSKNCHGGIAKSAMGGMAKFATNNIDIYNKLDNKEDNKGRSASSSPSFNFKKALLDLGVTDETADAWLQVRRRLRAVNTQLAFTHIENEIRKSGKTAEECIRTAAEKSWRGFEAEWIKKTSPHTPSYQQPEKLNNYEKGLIVYDEEFGTHLYQDYLDEKRNRTYNNIDEQ